MAYSKAQNEANKKFAKENPEWKKYTNYKNWAKGFIRNHATKEDLEMIIEMAQEKLKESNED
ncbi:hypothetical protein ET006_05375 [Lactococcus garvieae]|uniref:Uncharacterized protein n=1 Tax=Lactococcus formosensis TaxID=1281486 RepID=A0A9Q9D651_9LACT|nr:MULTISPECIES: hypothetical protein [Lactococcus]NHI73542.1 hypothetical protein [Lactococcus garvieae]UKS68432.1 hypothetical protein G8766_04260 [Lactococcus garvieae]USJ19541.1 hypothetical protein LMK00_06810 [Lactococcus formosensis]